MPDIHHVFNLDVPRERVWFAVTDPAGLRGWWSTGLESPPAALGVRQKWTFAGDFNPVMEITGLVPVEQVRWRCVAGHSNWTDNRFMFELDGVGDARTVVRFWQHYAVEPDDDAFGIYNFNWGYYLESLRLFAATGRGKPFVAG